MALWVEELCRNSISHIFLVAVFCVAATLPALYLTGLRSTGDVVVLTGFAQEVRSAASDGDLRPGWSDDVTGYGSVGIRFYPPMSFYLLALLGGVLGWYHAIFFYIVLWHVVAGIGVYLFARDLAGAFFGLAAALLYSVAPFRILEVFQFSLLAEFAACGIAAFCFFFVRRICREREWKYVIGLAFAIGGVILTHLPTTLIAGSCLAVYSVFLIGWTTKDRWRQMSSLLVAVFFGLALSSFYWIDVVSELTWLAHGEGRYSSSFDQWLFPYGFLANADGINVGLWRNLNLAVLIVIFLLLPSFMLAGSVTNESDSPRRRATYAVTATAIFGLLMLSRLSLYAWQTLPLLHHTQFPWRWLGITSLAATVSFAGALSLYTGNDRRRNLIAFLLTVTVFGTMLAYDLRRSYLRSKIMSSAEFQQVLTDSSRDAETTFAAWWPVWAKGDALRTSEKVTAAGRVIAIATWAREKRVVEVDPGPETKVRFAFFYYPLWVANVNGSRVQTELDENGAMIVPIGEGHTTIELTIEESRSHDTAGWISAATLLLLVGSAILGAGRSGSIDGKTVR